MKSKNIVFVHGLFGWGPGELGGLPYWGDALAQFEGDFNTYWAKCGPISSFHDRACELFAQIKGAQVDYGEAHSAAAGHDQKSRDYSGKPFVQNWSADNPVILVGHSAGAQTCLQLQQLLARNFWECGSNAQWVEAIVSISGVINGSTATYLAGCDRETGKLKHLPSFFIQRGLDILKMIGTEPVIDLYLDQWTHGKTPINDALFKKIDDSNFVNGDDNLAFDLSLQGCCKANENFDTQKGTYYLSIVTSKTDPLLGKQRPAFQMNPLLQPFALYQGVDDPFGNPPIKPVPGWGAGDLTIDKWRENDGAVSSISQRFPFTAGDHPVGGEGIFGRPAGAIQKGKWYYQRAENIVQHRFDHFDVVLGSKINMLDRSVEAAQRNLYRELCTFLRDL
jgi:triacylglycerol esterase/lipase EstA (alpha/beta hydrolase family)